MSTFYSSYFFTSTQATFFTFTQVVFFLQVIFSLLALHYSEYNGTFTWVCFFSTLSTTV